MTVQELINKLKKFPRDIDVVVYDEFGHRWLDEDPYIFPEDQDIPYMKKDKVNTTKRLVLSFNGKYD